MLAFSRSLRPRYWEATTAPPVASAENILISSTLMESTREIPDTAASPQVETIMVSIMPMVTASNCSSMSGMSRRRRSSLEKSMMDALFLSQISILYRYSCQMQDGQYRKISPTGSLLSCGSGPPDPAARHGRAIFSVRSYILHT